MPEYLRALVVVLALGAGVLWLAKAPACASAIAAADYLRRRNVWFAITLILFLAHNFWVFMLAAGAVLLYAAAHDRNKLALFFFVLFAAPAIRNEIPGLGPIRFIFNIDYLRLMSLTVLALAFFEVRRDKDRIEFGALLPDKLLAAYVLLIAALVFKVSSVTETLRQGIFYGAIDILLPYYVASRLIKTSSQARDVFMSFLVAALVLAPVALFEFGRHWLLYSMVDDQMGLRWALGRYLERDGGSLRALATTGQPIALGYVFVVAICLCLGLRKALPSRFWWGLALVVLAAGLVAPVSRGPWIGAIAAVLVFIAMGPAAVSNLTKLVLLAIVCLPVILATPLGDKLIAHLPFVGTLEVENVTYRQRLLEISIDIISRNPFFGAFDYFLMPDMDELRQSGGTIDVVNSFLGVGLASGLTGLSLYCGFFVAVLVDIARAMRRLPDRKGELYDLGRALFATLIGVLITIFTVSSITVIPWIYWTFAGLGVAYARAISRETVPKPAPGLALAPQGRPEPGRIFPTLP